MKTRTISRCRAIAAAALSSFGALACSGDDGSGSAANPSSGAAAGANNRHEPDAGASGASSAGGASTDGSPAGGSTAGGAVGSGGTPGAGGTLGTGASGSAGASGAGTGGAATDGGSSDSGMDARDTDGALPPLTCNGPGPRFATRVVSEAFGPGQNFGQDQLPGIVLGPPKGGGATQGSLDVASLGNGGSITLAFDGNAIVDGPGPDFIVFENAFSASGNPATPYAEPGTVAVSDDGVTWTSFPCTATAYPYGSCAGWHVVYANSDTNSIDATDPAVAGGDAFDLADIGVLRARFVRVTDRPDLPTVFDLDAMSIVHGLCE